MIADDIVRMALLVLCGLFGPIAMTYRIRSQTHEKLDRWQEGAVILFGLRLGAIPVVIAVLTWLIHPGWMAWSSLPLPTAVRYAGIALSACSKALVVWTFRNLGGNLTDTVVTRQQHTLVTSGPYRLVRHPFYLAFGVGLAGASLAMANWFIFLAGCLPLGFLIVRTRIEERKLVERFGSDYEAYMQRVGRFIPGCKW